jgi:sugar lactone lactonase YvrE
VNRRHLSASSLGKTTVRSRTARKGAGICLLFLAFAAWPLGAAVPTQKAHFTYGRAKKDGSLRSSFPSTEFAIQGRAKADDSGLITNQDFGTVSVGATGSAVSLTVTFDAAVTLGSIAVLTEGAPNLDFANAGTGSCTTGTPYTLNATCTIVVTFAPSYPGTRLGAVVLADNNGNEIATGYVQGTGLGPQATFAPGTQVLVTYEIYSYGTAVDGAGNVYANGAIPGSTGALFKESLSGGVYTQTTLLSGSSWDSEKPIAMDAAGNIYGVGASYNAIVKETPSNGTYTQTPVASGFTYIVGVAVDGSGNVYIADQGGKAVYKETLSSGTYTQSTVVSGLNGPSAVAVDAVGNVYIVDSGGILYKAAPSSGSYAITQVASGASYVAVDPSGNVYYSTQGYGTGIIYKETPSGRGYIQTVVASGLDYVDSLVADGNGNLYAGGFDEGYGLTKLDLLDPPALGFANTVYGTISTDSPQVVTVSNLGNENLAFSQVSYPLDFPEVPGIAGDCTGSTSLAAAKSCTLTIDFAPLADLGGAASAALSENASVATNTLNTSATEQQMGLSGSELQATPTVTLTASVNPGSVGNPVTFTATVAGVGDGAIPDGTVSFSYSSPVGSGTNVSTMSGGVATFTTSALVPGSYAFSATYSGNTDYASVASNNLTEIITGVNYGSVSVASSQTIAVTIPIASAAILSGISVTTQGATGLDFTNAGGGSCTVTNFYGANSTCTVNIAFNPKFAGTRMGAVVLTDPTGATIATGYLRGTGVAPEPVFTPAVQTPVVTGLAEPTGIAIDASGNLYIADTHAGALYKETPSAGGGYTQTTVATVSSPYGVAVDGAGNIYVNSIGTIYRETPTSSGYVQTAVGGSGDQSIDFAVDGSGNVYVASGSEIYEYSPSATGYHALYFGTGLTGAVSIGVDGAGNLYVLEYDGALYKETLSNGSYTQSQIASGLGSVAYALTVDGEGNVYVVNWNGTIYRETPSKSGYVQTTLATNFIGVEGVAVDARGNVYVPQTLMAWSGNVVKVDLADPPAFTFASTVYGSTSTDSPRAATVSNYGNAALKFSDLSYPADFPRGAGTGACAATTSLAANARCTLSIDFSPLAAVNAITSVRLSEDVTLTTNGLNGAAVKQFIAVSGTETKATPKATLTTSINPSPQDGDVTFKAEVAGVTHGTVPTGTVSFFSGTTLLRTVTLSDGAAIFTTSKLSGGQHAITTTYSGNSFYTAVTSNAIAEDITALNYGAVSVGAGKEISASLTMAEAGKLGSISVLTQGAANLDFRLSAGGTCAVGTTYPANATCTVNVTFRPKYAGSRYGAVVLIGATGKVLATGYLLGSGETPQTIFTPPAQTTVGTGLKNPWGVAVDGNGNIYITNISTNALYKETPSSHGGYLQTSIGSGFGAGQAAVDGAGNLYIVGASGSTVYKETLANGRYSQTRIGSGLVVPAGVAVDSSGNVYVTDSYAGLLYKETLSNGSYTQTIVIDNLGTAGAVAVDSSGNLYIADPGTNAVYTETFLDGAYTQKTVGAGLSNPQGIAIDGLGNLYIADNGNSRVLKETWSQGRYTQSQLFTSFYNPKGLAVDAEGNLYIAANSEVNKEAFASPPSVAFGTTPRGSASNDSPQIVTVSNFGNAPLRFSNVAYSPDFPESKRGKTDCKSTTSLEPDVSCPLTINFSPETQVGSSTSLALSESVTVTTNTLSTAATEQKITVTGTETEYTLNVTLTASVSTATAGSQVTFNANLAEVSGGPSPGGTVTFYSGSSALVTTAVKDNRATLVINSLPVGTHSISALYSGDSTYAETRSNSVTETITKAGPAVKLTSSANPGTAGEAIKFTATVTGLSDVAAASEEW